MTRTRTQTNNIRSGGTDQELWITIKIARGNKYMDIVEQICLVMILSMLLTQVLLPSLRNFYGRHHDMINRYGTSVSLMATGVLHVSQSLSQFFNSHLIFDQINTKGVTGTAYSSRSPAFTRGSYWFSFLCSVLKTIVCLYIFLNYCIVCPSWFTTSD
jgi:hypothetical protein